MQLKLSVDQIRVLTSNTPHEKQLQAHQLVWIKKLRRDVHLILSNGSILTMTMTWTLNVNPVTNPLLSLQNLMTNNTFYLYSCCQSKLCM